MPGSQPAASAASHAAFTAPAPISVPRLPVVWPAPSSRVVSTTHPDALGIDAELLDRDLPSDRVHALAHLGPAVPHLDGAVGLEAHHRAGDLEEAVAEAGVLEPEADADRRPRRDCGVVRGLDRVEAARAPRQPSSMIWPGPHTSPGDTTLRRGSPSR